MPQFAQADLPRLDLPPGAVSLLGWAIGGYVLFLLAISIYATGKIKDEADYVVAGRRLPLFLAWGTLIATWFGAATMFAAAGAAASASSVFFPAPIMSKKKHRAASARSAIHTNLRICQIMTRRNKIRRLSPVRRGRHFFSCVPP